MNYIANIYTKSKFEAEDFFNIVDDKSKFIDGIPTLVIGWDSVNSLYENVNILNKKVDDNVYWTFGKRERRNVMEIDIQKFKKRAMSIVSNSVKYSFFNILTETSENKKKFYEFLKSSSKKAIFQSNGMLYIYNKDKNTVVSISIRDVEYVNGDVKKLFSVLYGNKNVKIISDSDLASTNAKFFFKDNVYLIPYIFS